MTRDKNGKRGKRARSSSTAPPDSGPPTIENIKVARAVDFPDETTDADRSPAGRAGAHAAHQHPTVEEAIPELATEEHPTVEEATATPAPLEPWDAGPEHAGEDLADPEEGTPERIDLESAELADILNPDHAAGAADAHGAHEAHGEAHAHAEAHAHGANGGAGVHGRDAESETDGDGEIEHARELSDAHLRGLLEALVFASDKPMKSGELARLASAPVKQVKPAMAALRAEYATRGIVLDEVAGGWIFRTNAQFAPFVRELAGGRPVKLSRAQLETLAIAAYRQPITRPEIDEIRGVDSGATLKLLLERDLVRILGKKDEPGRPLLYGTTTQFLEFFNMKSLRDLPTLREFTELSDESRRVAEAELGDVLPDVVHARPASEPHTPAPKTAVSFGGPSEPGDDSAEPGDPTDPNLPESHDPDDRAMPDEPNTEPRESNDLEGIPEDERDTLGPPPVAESVEGGPPAPEERPWPEGDPDERPGSDDIERG